MISALVLRHSSRAKKKDILVGYRKILKGAVLQTLKGNYFEANVKAINAAYQVKFETEKDLQMSVGELIRSMKYLRLHGGWLKQMKILVTNPFSMIVQ